jgi:hypothetical protein
VELFHVRGRDFIDALFRIARLLPQCCVSELRSQTGTDSE